MVFIQFKESPTETEVFTKQDIFGLCVNLKR